MPTFIKTGFWEKLSKAPKEYLNLDNLIQSIGGGGTSYKKYVALLSQVGEEDPEVIVLENTIGNIVWAREGTGYYTATLIGAFPTNKTWCSAISGANTGNSGYFNFCKDDTSNDFLKLLFADGSSDINSNNPEIVYECSIEIRVYP
jgi:hypothetical protein